MHTIEVEIGRPGFALGHPATGDDGEDQTHQADDRHLTDAARPQVAGVDPHEDGERYGEGHGVGAPGAVGQRLDHYHRQHRQDDHHDHEGGNQGDDAGRRPHLRLDQLTEGAAIPAGGDEQHHEVLHRPRQHHPGQQPEHAGQVAHLGRQHRADQGAGTGDGGKVVAKQYLLVGRHIVQTVVVTHRRRHPGGIHRQHVLGNKQAVVAIGDQIDAHRRNHNPECVDLFAPIEGDITEGAGTDQRHQHPSKVFP